MFVCLSAAAADLMSRHSKVQLQVLSLYRRFLRVAENKVGATQHVREEFRRNAQIPRMDTVRIEHMIRRAERQLKALSNPSIKGIGVFQPEEGEGQGVGEKAVRGKDTEPT